MITVNVDDVHYANAYQFQSTASFREGWTIVPRKGDCILDLNEFMYRVVQVIWYSPSNVRIRVERFDG